MKINRTGGRFPELGKAQDTAYPEDRGSSDSQDWSKSTWMVSRPGSSSGSPVELRSQ